ncbi:MAG: hypothetical protein L0220_02365, partial [Acidobacteria bacterium]|nr:hypothetical protein [Acidobacteriota bacterium]
FLKSGVWDSENRPLAGVSLTFVYSLQGGRLNLSLAGASVVDRSSDEPRKLNGILAQANYHRECEGYPSHEQVIKHLSSTIDDWNHFRVVASDILG